VRRPRFTYPSQKVVLPLPGGPTTTCPYIALVVKVDESKFKLVSGLLRSWADFFFV